MLDSAMLGYPIWVLRQTSSEDIDIETSTDTVYRLAVF